jgi:two-component system CheB/CheR fusion protein
VKIKFEREEIGFNCIQVSVKDSGIGIPSDKIETIFDPFIQVSNDTARKYGGTGLGLTITKRIIDIMNGRIQVKSKLDVGTKFIVNLPFSKGNPDAIISESSISRHKPVTSVAGGKKIKVLLAEDNRINQILVEKILSKFNFECVTVSNGRLAVDAVIQHDFDVVLMDIMMPIMDGYEATSIIRNLNDETKKNIPIIALTAVVTGSIIASSSSVGINRYLSKPFETEELYNVIIELVDKKNGI